MNRGCASLGPSVAAEPNPGRGVAVSPSANPVLLLHGQPGSARDWDLVVASLGAGANAVAVDRPGWNGRFAATDLAGNARAALAVLDARGIERAVVVGHSLGSGVAAWLAAEHPERVAALVLAAPTANTDSLNALDRWLAAPVAGHVASVTALAGLGLALSSGPVRRRIADDLALDDGYLQAAARRLLAPSTWRAFTTEQRGLVRDLPTLERLLEQISAPTTIVAGEADRIVPPASAERLAEQIRGAELVLVERAGHLLPLQHAPRLAKIIAAAHGRG